MRLFINFVRNIFKRNKNYSKNNGNKTRKTVLPNLIFEKK